MSRVRYVIISPVRNEAEHIRATVASVAAQTIRPARWVIVDDGSSDATPSLIDEAARQHDWITATHRKDRGRRLAGSGVMQAFFAGLARLETNSWQFLAKLDGDVTFEPDYFERCFDQFAAEPRLGIAGGLICNRVDIRRSDYGYYYYRYHSYYGKEGKKGRRELPYISEEESVSAKGFYSS